MATPPVQKIVNGDFSAAPSGGASLPWVIVSSLPGGWSGSDIEWGQQSNYISGSGGTNRIVEMDGNGGSAITQLSQSFTVDGQVNAVLSFDMALRNELATNVGEGFRVDILSGSTVIQSQTYFPTLYSWQTVSLSVPLNPGASPGTFSVRFTELGPNNSLGAIIDDISFLVCFTAGTLIDTPDGPRRVEDLCVGDLVLTMDDGPQPIRWVGHRTLRLQELLCDPRLWPVTIAANAFGPAQPARDLAVSRQHRILRSGWACELYFGEPEVLVSACKLVNGGSVRLDPPITDVTYIHFLCDNHQIVFAEGLATESFYPSALSLSGVAAEAKAELLLIFPELHDIATPPLATARMVVAGKVARLAA